jgi:RHS repeat-associated protein
MSMMARTSWPSTTALARAQPSTRRALVVDQPLATWRGGQVAYYQADGLGSITSLTDSTGTPLATYTYDTFGKTTATGALFNPFQFTGREWDQETGLYYCRARYYSSDMGRFWGMDTEDGDDQDPISLHKYLYAEGSPVNNVDPSGDDETLDTIYGKQIRE